MALEFMLNISNEEKKELVIYLLEKIKKRFPDRRWGFKEEVSEEHGYSADYNYILSTSYDYSYTITERTGWFKRRTALGVHWSHYEGNRSLFSVYDCSLFDIATETIREPSWLRFLDRSRDWYGTSNQKLLAEPETPNAT